MAQIDIEPGNPLTLHYGSGYWCYVLREYGNFDTNQRLSIEHYISKLPAYDDNDDNDVDNV